MPLQFSGLLRLKTGMLNDGEDGPCLVNAPRVNGRFQFQTSEREGGSPTSKRYSAIGANERGGTEKWRRRRRPDDYSSGKATGNSGRAQMTGLVDLPACLALPPPDASAAWARFRRVPPSVHSHETRLMHARRRPQRASERARGQGRVPGQLSRDHFAVVAHGGCRFGRRRGANLLS